MRHSRMPSTHHHSCPSVIKPCTCTATPSSDNDLDSPSVEYWALPLTMYAGSQRGVILVIGRSTEGPKKVPQPAPDEAPNGSHYRLHGFLNWRLYMAGRRGGSAGTWLRSSPGRQCPDDSLNMPETQRAVTAPGSPF
jgi:hypothetical protein